MERLVVILDFLFGCHHGHLSRVFTIGGRTYKVCCNCGKKFTYSLANMHLEQPIWAVSAGRNGALVEGPRSREKNLFAGADLTHSSAC